MCLWALFPGFCRPPTVIATVIGEVITPFPQEMCPGFLAPATIIPPGGAANKVLPLGNVAPDS